MLARNKSGWILLEYIDIEEKDINKILFSSDGEITMKKIASFIPALLWLILSIYHFVGGNLKKGIVFIVCAVGWAVVELIFMKWQKK